MWLPVQHIYELIPVRYREMYNARELCFTCFKVKYRKIIFFKWNVNNWHSHIDFNLEVFGVIVFLEFLTRADFFSKLYRVNSVDMLYSLSHKVQQTFKFTFQELKCNNIWYMFAVIKVIKTYLFYPVAK